MPMVINFRDATPEDAADLARCVIEPILTTFRGRVPDQCLEWLTPEESETNWRRYWSEKDTNTRFLLVAESPSGDVVGCAMGGPQPNDLRFEGELYVLGVLPDYQGQGIGARLVRMTAERLAHDGLHSMGVRVLQANPNTAFYEHLNAQYLSEEPYDWNGVELPMLVYAWPDTAVLFGNG